jgi:hypothetical protein
MKKFLIFFICLVAFSSHKNCDPSGKAMDPSHAIIITTGILRYDNFPDGWRLYYETGSSVYLIFKNNLGSDSALYNHYKAYVNQHTKLSYQNSGETGCVYGIGPVCGISVVDVIDLKNE